MVSNGKPHVLNKEGQTMAEKAFRIIKRDIEVLFTKLGKHRDSKIGNFEHGFIPHLHGAGDKKQWIVSDVLDDGHFGILDNRNQIIIGAASPLTEEQAEKICFSHNSQSNLGKGKKP